MDTAQHTEKHDAQVSRATLKVAIGGGLSLAAGLASQVITAYLFGAGSEMDAFFTALTIPVYVQYVLLGGLPFVVIPAFVSKEASGNDEDAWALAGTFIWLIGGIFLAGSLIGALASSQIIAITSPGFGAEKSALATRMLSILMFTIPFSGLGTFTSSIENVRGRFFWPAAATAIGSLGNVIVLLVLHPLLGPIALAWGNLASAVLLAAVTTIPVFMHGWKKTLRLTDPGLIELIKLIAPFILFGFITQGKQVLERFFASGLPDGQLSYIGYAYKISNIFVILLATSIASAIFPAMARAFSTEGILGLVKKSDYGMRFTLALAVPAVFITTILAVPLVKLFYERGAFLPETTLSVALLIPIVMLNDVFFRMVSNMVIRTFFVLKDTLTTNIISSLSVIVYIFVAQSLTARWGYLGLALAQPIQFGLAVAVMTFLLFRRIKEFSAASLFKSLLIYTLISAVAALAGWGLLQLLHTVPSVFQLAASGLLSVTIYLALLFSVDRGIAISLLDMTGLTKIYAAIKRARLSKITPYGQE